MLKKMFLGVLFTVFGSGLLIAGINFNVNVIKAGAYGSSSTPVGGIIWENTTWTPEGSPYIISEVQVADNVTILIKPGVTVIGGEITPLGATGRIDLWGTIRAHGTISEKIVFKNVFLNVRGGVLDLEYCVLEDYSGWYGGPGICSQYGGDINIRRSKIYDYGVIDVGHGYVNIEYNQLKINQIWAENSLGTRIRYNVFVNVSDFAPKKPDFSTYPGYITDCYGGTVVQYNTFENAGGIVLALSPGRAYARMVATENYWGTENTTAIDLMIYDRKDNIECGSFIEYLPILTEPHPDAPIMLEDLKVGVNGVFRKDHDGKWRCYTNITIRNNSYRNVTISWIYLEAINITYTDETSEELNISGNETLNHVIQPEQEFSIEWTVTTFGFTKEPKILWVLFKTPVQEAYGTITLTTVIPEFPSATIMSLFMFATLITTILLKRKRKPKSQLLP
jgi:hypothetical protein